MTNTRVRTFNADMLMEQAKKIRATKDTVGKLKLIQEVPSKNQAVLLELIEELGKEKQGVEVYMNKKGEAVGITVHGQGYGKRGIYIPNKAIASWNDINDAVSEYRLNPSHTF